MDNGKAPEIATYLVDERVEEALEENDREVLEVIVGSGQYDSMSDHEAKEGRKSM